MITAYLRSIAKRLLRRGQTDREMHEELESHVQLRADALERDGLDRPEAERRARIEFGGHSRFKEECREAMGGNAIDQAIQDVRFSLRALRKSPGFSLVAVITLALGIGATVATFSVVNTVLLRPFAFSHPEKLLWIYSQRSDNPRTNFSLPEYCDYRDQTTSFEALAGVASFNPSFADSGPPERVQGVRMSASAFTMLGVRPFLGRTLIAEDDRNGARGVAVISYGLWSRRYARDPAVIGRAVNVNGETREIVGVLPASFALPNLDTEIVVPLQPDSDPRRNLRNSVNFLRMVGRLKSNVTAQQAHAELEAIRQNLRAPIPGHLHRKDRGNVGSVNGRDCGEYQVGVADNFLRGRRGASGRLRQSGRHFSFARSGATTGTRSAHSIGRDARSTDATVADGKFRSCADGRVVRHVAGGLGPEDVASFGSDGPAANREFLNRLDGPGVCRCSHICRRARVRTGAGVAAFSI